MSSASGVQSAAITKYYVETYQGVVDDYNQRLEETDKKVLDRGYWYANDYYTALKTHGQQARIEFFRDKAVYDKTARNAFYYGFADKTCFTHVVRQQDLQNPGSAELCFYSLKKGKTPTEGLNSIRTSVGFIDCQEAIEIAQYETLQRFMGEERFNDKFSADGNTPMTFRTDLGKTPLVEFNKLAGARQDAEVQLGDFMFFRNVPFYGAKHPNEDLLGDNMVCVQADGTKERKYTSLGVPKEGITVAQVYQRFIIGLNKPEGRSQEVVTPELWARLQVGLDPMLKQLLIQNPNHQTNMHEFLDCIRHFQHSPLERVGFTGMGTRFDATVIEKYIP